MASNRKQNTNTPDTTKQAEVAEPVDREIYFHAMEKIMARNAETIDRLEDAIEKIAARDRKVENDAIIENAIEAAMNNSVKIFEQMKEKERRLEFEDLLDHLDTHEAREALEAVRLRRTASMTWAEYAQFIAGENWKPFLGGALAAVATVAVGRLGVGWYNRRIGGAAEEVLEASSGPELAVMN